MRIILCEGKSLAVRLLRAELRASVKVWRRCCTTICGEYRVLGVESECVVDRDEMLSQKGMGCGSSC